MGTVPLNTKKAALDLSQYELEVLRNDEEFVLYRCVSSNQLASKSVLLLAPASVQPTAATLIFDACSGISGPDPAAFWKKRRRVGGAEILRAIEHALGEQPAKR
jgi:hypothetical protein